MALFLAAPLAQGLLATAIRTAGSKAVQPYVTALVQRGAGKKAATSIAKEYVKTVGKANKTGSFPLIDKAATKNITNALNNTQRSELQRKGLLASETPAATISKQRMVGSGQTRRKLQEQIDRQGAAKFDFPPPNPVINPSFNAPILTQAERQAAEAARRAASATAETQRQAGAAAFNRASNRSRGLDMLNKPIVQTADASLTGLQTTGLLGGLSVAPMFFGGGQPQPVIANAVGLPQVAQAPQEQLPRFGQVLRPSSESTSKEVINAALLRAGLTLLRGGTGTEALESAASVADSQTTYRTGAQALKAGQEALGKDAKISIYQRSDGSFGYQGTTQDTSSTDNSFFRTEGQTNNITKQQYDEAVAKIKADYPNATDQDIKDTLEANNIIYTGA